MRTIYNVMKDDEREPFHWDGVGLETTFVENMRMLREQRGISQTELARRAQDHGLPFHQVTVQRIESGQRPVKLTEALVISTILGSHLQTMMDDVSLPFAYDMLVHESGWERLSGTLDRAADSARSVQYIERLVKESLEDYERAADRFNEDANEDIVNYAHEVLARLRKAVEAVERSDAEVQALAQGIKQLPTPFPREAHGGRPYLKGVDLSELNQPPADFEHGDQFHVELELDDALDALPDEHDRPTPLRGRHELPAAADKDLE